MSIFFDSWIFVLILSLGSHLLQKFNFRFNHQLEAASFGFALGFGLLGYGILILGLVGFLHLGLFLTVLGLLTLFLWREEAFWLKQAFSAARSFPALRKKNAGLFFLVLASAAVFGLALLQSLLPPTASDSLCYHLYLPKRFVEEHKIQYFPYLVNSLFPFLMEMHYTLALLLKQPELANLLHLSTGVGTFLGMVALGRRLNSTSLGLMAGLIFILTPGIFNQMAITYNDVALTFFSFFSFYAFLLSQQKGADTPWYILMGVFSGFALSVKYLGLLHVGAITMMMLFLWTTRRIRGNQFAKFLAFYCIFVFIFSFLWYLRSYFYEGNPVYPFFQSIFGGTAKEYNFAKAGFGKGPLDLLLLGWRATFFPQFFGGTWTQLGVMFLTFLPLVFFLRVQERTLQLMAGFSILFFLSWFCLVQNLRFLFPVIPVMSLLIALAARPFLFWLILILSLNAGLAIYHGKEGYPFLLGFQDREAYLRRVERTYPLSLWLNENLPPGAKVLNAEEIRMFYFSPEMVRESEFRKKARYDQINQSPREVMAHLRKEGITHLLLAEAGPDKLPPSELNVKALVKNKSFVEHHLNLRHEETAPGGIRYRVYEIRYPND